MQDDIRITEMKLSGNPGGGKKAASFAKFTLDTGVVTIPRCILARRESGSVLVSPPVIVNSFGYSIAFAAGVYRDVLVNAVEVFVLMGGKFPDETYAPKWMELDDGEDWGGLRRREVESA